MVRGCPERTSQTNSWKTPPETSQSTWESEQASEQPPRLFTALPLLFFFFLTADSCCAFFRLPYYCVVARRSLGHPTRSNGQRRRLCLFAGAGPDRRLFPCSPHVATASLQPGRNCTESCRWHRRKTVLIVPFPLSSSFTLANSMDHFSYRNFNDFSVILSHSVSPVPFFNVRSPASPATPLSSRHNRSSSKRSRNWSTTR